MVTFPPVGRMGNFLFECAAALSYSLKHGLEFTTPGETNSNVWNPLYLHHLQNPEWEPLRQEIHLHEDGHNYNPIEFREEWRDKNIIIEGYRQSEKYFLEHRWQILGLFAFPWKIKKGVVSVHIRRGDYLELPEKHPVIPPEWYVMAMGMFHGKNFLFHSDDIEWCKQTFSNIRHCKFYDGKDEIEDLISMSSCEHQICSASTFAWWGAWLNRNPHKHIVFPKQWFVPGYCDLNTDDIIPEQWTKL